MAAIDNFISVVEDNPLLVVGGVLGSVFLFSLMGRGGGDTVARVMPEHTLQSQKIAADTNVALAGIQAQAQQSYVNLAEVSAARDVGLYQAAVQANLGKSATDAAVASAAYNLAGQNVQAKTALAITEIQGRTVDNQTRAALATNMASITAGYVANRDQLQVESQALDVQKALGFREQQTVQARDSLQAANERLAISNSRDVAFKALDVENLVNQRTHDIELTYARQVPDMFNNQLWSNERINAAYLETQQYIAKKATKGGILGNLISGGFGLANNLVSKL